MKIKIFSLYSQHILCVFWKGQNDKYSDYLNVVICESDGKNGLHYTSYVDIDTSIKQGIEMKSKKNTWRLWCFKQNNWLSSRKIEEI